MEDILFTIMAFSSSKGRKLSKPGKTTLRAFHFRIEANNAESNKLHRALGLAWELRNDQVIVLEAARCAARSAKLRGEEPQYVSALDLKKMVASGCLPPKFGGLHSQVRQDISTRVSEGQKRWFEAVREGRRHVRPPAPMARKDFRSITYPQYGTAAHVKNGILHMSKLGDFRVRGWRKMRGAKKSMTIKFKDGHFWAIVMCEAQERDVCRPYAEVRQNATSTAGLPDGATDPGLTSVLNDSLGTSYATPKPLKKAAVKLRRLQKDVSRKFEVRKAQHMRVLAAARTAAEPDSVGAQAPVAAGIAASLRLIPYSGRLRQSIRKLAKAHSKVKRVRDDAAKKTARRIERTFARVAVEEHSLKFMVRNRLLAKTTADVAIGKQKQALRSALGSGRYAKASNIRPGGEGGNSQTCLCGAHAPKELKQRWHKCPDPACGLEGPRDQMAAIICQYETFGTVPKVKENSAPGLGALGKATLLNAVRLLEQRRGESNGKARESRRAERGTLKKSFALELSVKRPAPGTSSTQQTAGGISVSSAGANTVDHAGTARSWSTEAPKHVARDARSTRRQQGAPRSRPRSPLLQVGE